MRVFNAEFGHNYGVYSFGYATYAKLAVGDDPTRAYEAGFLPKSNDPRVLNLFYMARSARARVRDFSPTSENRRVFKKFDGAFSSDYMKRDTLAADENFQRFFIAYFAERHGEAVMPAERLYGILQTPLPLRGVCYRKDGAPAAYVLEAAHGDWMHYWFSAYDSSYAHTGLGMWLMQDALRRAADEKRRFLYLGTAYGDKGRYKTNIAPLEFWDGETWNDDIRRLKRLIKEDAERGISFGDRLKEK